MSLQYPWCVAFELGGVGQCCAWHVRVLFFMDVNRDMEDRCAIGIAHSVGIRITRRESYRRAASVLRRGGHRQRAEGHR